MSAGFIQQSLNDQINMNEIITALIGLIGVGVGVLASYFLGLKQILIQNRIEHKIKLYLDLFNKLRNFSSTKHELNNIICNAQLFASDEIITFLNKLNVYDGITEKDIHDLFVLMRKDLGVKKRKRLTLYFYKYPENDSKENL